MSSTGRGFVMPTLGQSWNSYYNNCIVSAQISDCAIRSTGDIYLCHSGAGVSWINPKGQVSGLWSVLPVPVQVRIDSKGRVWLAHFASDGGLAVFDPSDGTWQKVQWGASSSWNIIDAFGLDQYDTKWVFNGRRPLSSRLILRFSRPCLTSRGSRHRRAGIRVRVRLTRPRMAGPKRRIGED